MRCRRAAARAPAHPAAPSTTCAAFCPTPLPSTFSPALPAAPRAVDVIGADRWKWAQRDHPGLSPAPRTGTAHGCSSRVPPGAARTVRQHRRGTGAPHALRRPPEQCAHPFEMRAFAEQLLTARGQCPCDDLLHLDLEVEVDGTRYAGPTHMASSLAQEMLVPAEQIDPPPTSPPPTASPTAPQHQHLGTNTSARAPRHGHRSTSTAQAGTAQAGSSSRPSRTSCQCSQPGWKSWCSRCCTAMSSRARASSSALSSHP